MRRAVMVRRAVILVQRPGELGFRQWPLLLDHARQHHLVVVGMVQLDADAAVALVRSGGADVVVAVVPDRFGVLLGSGVEVHFLRPPSTRAVPAGRGRAQLERERVANLQTELEAMRRRVAELEARPDAEATEAPEPAVPEQPEPRRPGKRPGHLRVATVRGRRVGGVA